MPSGNHKFSEGEYNIIIKKGISSRRAVRSEDLENTFGGMEP